MTREIRLPGIRRVLRVSWSRDAIARDIDDEIQFHIDARADELRRLGASEKDARARAEAEFGDRRAATRELSAVDQRRQGRANREDIFMSFFDDLRYSWRALVRRPGLLVVTTIALAIGIAANAVMFGIVDQLLIQPPALVDAPDEVVRVYYRQTSRGDVQTSAVTTYRVISTLRDEVNAFDQVAATWRASYTFGSGAGARSVDIAMVSGSYFPLLGIRPRQGRLLTPGDERPPVGEHVAVLSAGFARQQFGADTVIGKDIRLQGETFRVVGIAPEQFNGIDRRRIDIWVPATSLGAKQRGSNWHLEDNSWWLEGIARLAPGTSAEVAAGEATKVFRGIQREWAREDAGEDTLGTVLLGSILPTRGPAGLTPESKVSVWVLGVSVIVLIIACANVANLLIARTHQRRREIAVRMAMGVSRWRLGRLLLAESAILAALGGVVALLIAYVATPLVQRVLLPDVVWNERVFDGSVLLLTLGTMTLCVVLAGIAPALQGIGTRVSEGLKANAAQIAGTRSRLRFALLVTQAALSVVLLVGAGLFVKSLDNVVSTDVGMDLDRVLLVQMRMEEFGFTTARNDELYDRAADRVGRIPGVARASVVRQLVPKRSASGMAFRPFGVDSSVRFENGGPYYGIVGSSYFPTIGASMIRGRNFTPSEDRVPSRVMIINRELADGYWKNGDPVGKCVRLGSDSVCTMIVGVVENVLLFNLVRDTRALLYIPPSHPSWKRSADAMLARVSADIDRDALIPVIRREVQRLAPDMPHVTVSPYSELVAPELRPWRLGAAMFGVYGIIALVIAGVGLYSVMAYGVAQRTQEIGVRMALGARRSQIIGLVSRQSAQGILLGVVLGCLIAVGTSRWIQDLLYQTSPRDPIVYTVAVFVLFAAAILASIIPVRRSTSVDPVIALRTE